MHSIKTFLLSQLHELHFSLNALNITEILFLVIVVLFAYNRYIKGTYSEKFVKGVFILLLSWLFAEFLIKINLIIIGVFIKSIIAVVAFSLVIIFQPELRRFLGYLGQGGFWAKYLKKTTSVEKNFNLVHEIIEAVKYLKKSRTGALMVLQKDVDETSYPDVGTRLDANVSQELLLTIFHPNTPLHDGAVVICDDKIISAGVLLPLTEDPKLSWKYGTRHRAAIGMSEVSDAACLVVSEETGEVSMSVGGVLKKYDDISLLKIDLENILGYKREVVEEKTLLNFITIKKNKTLKPKGTK